MQRRGNLSRFGRDIAFEFQAVFFNAMPGERGKSSGRKYRQRSEDREISMQRKAIKSDAAKSAWVTGKAVEINPVRVISRFDQRKSREMEKAR